MRAGAAAHIDVGHHAVAGGLTPMMVDGENLVLWLRADIGVMLDSASVSNDTTEASGSWVKSNCTRTDAADSVTLTDTNDGATPTLHRISNTAVNWQNGPSLLDVWAQAGTTTWLWVLFGGSGVSIYLDLVNDVSGTASGGAIARFIGTEPNGLKHWRVEASLAGGTAVIVNMATADTAGTYIGDGTGTVVVGTGATYGPRLTQDRVSQWADQSGRGHHALQATASAQPLYQQMDSSGLWVPSGGTPRIGWPAAATKVFGGANLATMAATFDGDSTPITSIELARRLATITGTHSGLLLAGAPAQISHLRKVATSNLYNSFWTDNAGTSKSSPSAAGTVSTNWQDAAAVFDGADDRLWLAGAADGNNPRDRNVGTQTFTSGSIQLRECAVREMIVYKSALSDSDRARVVNGMRARWGLGPV